MKTLMMVSLLCLCGCSHTFRAGVESGLKCDGRSHVEPVEDVSK